MLGGVMFGHEQGLVAINAIHDLVREAGKPVWDWKAPEQDTALVERLKPSVAPSWKLLTKNVTSKCARKPCVKLMPLSWLAWMQMASVTTQ